MTAMRDLAMTEDELLTGITEALSLAGWRWTHIRDSRGITVGDSGLPDIIAVHPTRKIVLAWELKGTGGRPTGDQAAWITSMSALGVRINARFVYPDDYDAALNVIVGKGNDLAVLCVVCAQPAVRVLDSRSRSGLCAIHDSMCAE